MTGFLSVFKRELRGYFSTPLAYVFLVIFLFFSSWLTFQSNFFELRQASMRIFFSNLPLLFIFLVPRSCFISHDSSASQPTNTEISAAAPEND